MFVFSCFHQKLFPIRQINSNESEMMVSLCKLFLCETQKLEGNFRTQMIKQSWDFFFIFFEKVLHITSTLFIKKILTQIQSLLFCVWEREELLLMKFWWDFFLFLGILPSCMEMKCAHKLIINYTLISSLSSSLLLTKNSWQGLDFLELFLTLNFKQKNLFKEF